MSISGQDNHLYALLIGVNCYCPNRLSDGSSYKNLEGAVNDIDSTEAFLKERLQVSDDKIWKLTASNPNPYLRQPIEPPEKLPTYENMVAAFKAITQMAQPGDRIYIHYSGHGGQTKTAYPEVKGTDGIDESLVPVNIGQIDESGKPTSRYLRDLELAALLKAMVDKELVVTVVLDSCHSGGAARSDAEIRGLDVIDETPRPVTSDVADREQLIAGWQSLTGDAEGRGLSGWLPPSNDYVLLAACRPHEKAFETIFNRATGRKHGVLTYFMLQALEKGYAGLTYKDLYDEIGARIYSKCLQQVPMLLGVGDRLLFGIDRDRGESGIPVIKVNLANHQVTIQTGQASGIRRGVQFAIYSKGIRDFTSTETRLATAEAVHYSATEVQCKLEPIPDQRDVELGDQAVLISPPAQLVRQVCLLPQAEVRTQGMATPSTISAQQDMACEAIRRSIPEKGWVELIDANAVRASEDNENLQRYYVAINPRGEYEICDSTGILYDNIRPPINIDESRAAQKLVKRLEHLAKYHAALELNNPRSPLTGKLEVEWLGSLEFYDPIDPIPPQLKMRPLDNPYRPTIREKEWIFLQIINHYSSPLNIAVLDLASNWAIDQVYPSHPTENFVTLMPGKANKEIIFFQVSLPDGYENVTDIVKVFATKGAPNFRWLELPALDKPLVSSQSKSRGSDPLENLLAAIAEDQPGSRQLNAAFAYQEWTTKEIQVRVQKT